MAIDHRKSQPTEDKLSLKWARSRHVIHFKFQGPKHISGITKARIVKFLTLVGYIQCYQKDDVSPLKWAWLWSCGCFKILPFAVMQRVARVRQRQLSYLLILGPNHIFGRSEDMYFKFCMLIILRSTMCKHDRQPRRHVFGVARPF